MVLRKNYGIAGVVGLALAAGIVANQSVGKPPDHSRGGEKWDSPVITRPGLSPQDLDRIVEQAATAAAATPSDFRTGKTTKMHIAVVSREGHLLRLHSMPDAWVGSVDIAIAKARTAAFFSSNENALTSRVIGAASQPGQPLWGIWDSNEPGSSGGPSTRNGLIAFPGGAPLYKEGVLVGGIGVSGDAVKQDEDVAFAGMVGYTAPAGVTKLGLP